MTHLTLNEQEALLTLFKSIDTLYNAHTLSKKLCITHVGTQKLLKRLEEEGYLISKKIGKAIFYKPSQEERTNLLLEFLLLEEARTNRRWVEEFKDIAPKALFLVLFGSILVNEEKANDIDLLVILKGNKSKEVRKAVIEKQSLLPKNLHAIYLTRDDLQKNLKEGNVAMLDAIKNGIVLSGHQEYVEMLKDVASL